jgi:phosphatidylserine decarboxylase
MRVPIAREGFPFVVSTAGPAVVLLLAAGQVGGPVLWTLAIIISILAIAVLGFFRDPERNGAKGDELILSPADGKVIKVEHVEESSYLQGEALCVSIFLSLFDVHVNRYPVSGDVKLRDYEPGRFEPAWRTSASHSNERASTGIDANGQPVLVNQIAGLAAKRIVTYAEVGDEVEQGARMGMIRFGSRVDIYMSKDAVPGVKVGDRAVGGITVLAQMPGGLEKTE